MSKAADLLVEIGTEELPPTALKRLMTAFADGFRDELADKRLEFGDIEAYATPRRLALVVAALPAAQDDRETERKGPPVAVAYDDDGKPTPAAHAFAKKCGVAVAALERTRTDKGEYLCFRTVEVGAPVAELVPGMVEAALGRLPIARPMRWGASDAEFVRPVHWVVLLHGTQAVPGRVLGIEAGRSTRGHRFLAPAALEIEKPADYVSLLENEGHVIADFAARRARIERGVNDGAAECGGVPVSSEALFDEVTALVEWPVALTGRFEASFLSLPREVIVATLTSHQRYFPVENHAGELLPAFVGIANLVSTDPDRIREGNERVIRPRLADAAFFWDADRKVPLAERESDLMSVVYQKGLGTIRDKSARVARLTARIANAIDIDPTHPERAAHLAKCDLVTGMVGEFPELQGTMGRYYALADGEPADVAEAIGEQYLPRFAGDSIPETPGGRCLSIADKLDSLCGIFALGKRPSGNRDPFGLRRSALGIVRIVVEGRLDLNMKDLIAASVDAQPVAAAEDVEAAIYDYVIERMRAYYLERDAITVEMFEAVRQRQPESLLDFDERLKAVAAFIDLPSAASLAAANKRIANILRQAEHRESGTLDASLFREDAERSLYESLERARSEVAPLIERRSYTDALTRLADLRDPVDTFFDDVMVMADDEAVKLNRLTLLAELREQFLGVADVSRLSVK